MIQYPLFRPGSVLRSKQVSSSIGRVAVSKTVGWGFESLLACQRILPGLQKHPSKNAKSP